MTTPLNFDVFARDDSVPILVNDAAPLDTGDLLAVGATLDITAVGL